jgi:hypothetical protein
MRAAADNAVAARQNDSRRALGFGARLGVQVLDPLAGFREGAAPRPGRFGKLQGERISEPLGESLPIARRDTVAMRFREILGRIHRPGRVGTGSLGAAAFGWSLLTTGLAARRVAVRDDRLAVGAQQLHQIGDVVQAQQAGAERLASPKQVVDVRPAVP